MINMNEVKIGGNLGKDPELKTFTSGAKKAEFSVATNHNWTNAKGEKQKRTEWHSIAAWAKHADVAMKYLKKGDNVLIEGSIETREWADKDGVKHYRQEIKVSRIHLNGKPKEVATPATDSPLPEDASSEE